MSSLDRYDRQLLRLLQQDASQSVKQLAEAVNLSTTPCWKRLKRLADEGYIRARVALLDPEKLGLGLSVFVQLKTRSHNNAWLEDFARKVMGFEEVVEFYRMSGEWDYMLRVVVRDIAAYDAFYKRLIASVDGLSDISSNFAMEEIKNTTALPVGY